jgi:hypothetical protein
LPVAPTVVAASALPGRSAPDALATSTAAAPASTAVPAAAAAVIKRPVPCHFDLVSK